MPDGSIRIARPNVNQDFSTHLGLSGGGEVKHAGSIRFGNNDGPSRGRYLSGLIIRAIISRLLV